MSTPQAGRQPSIATAVYGVRYQTKDVARAVDFYTSRLGFTIEVRDMPAFAIVSLGGTRVLLSGPGASGSRPFMRDCSAAKQPAPMTSAEIMNRKPLLYEPLALICMTAEPPR